MSNAMEPFWGPITSSIDWCEPNYEFSIYVAEPLNTFSNLSFVVFGILGALHEINDGGFKRSYFILFCNIAAIGIGSMLFHGTLTMLGQQLDEIPMVWHLLICFYVINREAVGSYATKSVMTSLLFIYALIFSGIHIALQTTTAFQVHFGVLLAMVLLRVYQRFRFVDCGQQGRVIIARFVGSGLLAFACWLCDYHGCAFMLSLPVNPNLHMFWHLFMGYSAYCSVVMLKILEAAEHHKMLEIHYDFLFLPHASRSFGPACGQLGYTFAIATEPSYLDSTSPIGLQKEYNYLFDCEDAPAAPREATDNSSESAGFPPHLLAIA